MLLLKSIAIIACLKMPQCDPMTYDLYNAAEVNAAGRHNISNQMTLHAVRTHIALSQLEASLQIEHGHALNESRELF